VPRAAVDHVSTKISRNPRGLLVSASDDLTVSGMRRRRRARRYEACRESYGDGVIEVRDISKRFGSVEAVTKLSFDAHPGRVTGFLGPNGSGKSTTMRCMLGLDIATSGTARFAGLTYREITTPLHSVGSLLDAGYVHPGRTGRNHLRWMAMSNGIDDRRVDETLGLVGLSDAAGRRVKEYSLGMRQRLGLAGVMLGDPDIVMLDEPANGLDPEGIRWIRDILTHLAREGKTVLVSSHLLAEMSLMADDLVVIGRGRLIEQSSVADFVARHSATWTRVSSPMLERLMSELGSAVQRVVRHGETSADLHGINTAEVGELAAVHGIVLHELTTMHDSLEDAFLRLTAGAQEYATAPTPIAAPPAVNSPPVVPPAPGSAAGGTMLPPPSPPPAPPPAPTSASPNGPEGAA
jgi:ABC-2 type transport system ATP-binding protein